MIVIPAIYLSKGSCVSHYKGIREQETTFSKDPLLIARNFGKLGAGKLHLVNLDADAAGRSQNRKVALELVKHSGLNIQLADEFSSMAELRELLEGGIFRVSLNQFSENLLADALARFGSEKIIFTIRARRYVVIGRQGVEVFDYGREIAEKGVKHIIFRDQKSEGSLHPNFDEIEKLVFSAGANIYAFGGIGTMKDLDILQRAGAFGAVISRAFFEGRLEPKECFEKYGA